MKAPLNQFRFVRDLFWPTPDPLSSDYVEQKTVALKAEIEALPSENGILEEYKTTYANFLEAEENRRQSVEGRLTSLMGLASIAGTIVFGTILTQITGAVHVPPGALRWVIAWGSLYLVLQICSAIFAAVQGLSRQTYIRLTPSDLIAGQSSDKDAHLRSLVGKYLKTLADHQSQNDTKVSWMAAAHRAMLQFLCGLLLFALVGTYYAVKAPAAHDDLVDTLKRNHELQELVRGPAGPPGATGPKGDPCKTEQGQAHSRTAHK